MSSFKVFVFGICVTLCTITKIGFAQTDNYPDRPIKMVVAFAPGGFTDNLARVVSQKLSADLGQPVVVDNKPGATGTIGSDLVAKSKADGYTLLLAHFASITVAPAMYPKMPYNTLSDFTPIIRLASTPMVLVINASLPVNNLAEFIEYVRMHPDEISFASSGSGTAQQLAAVQFMQATKTKMIHVPYKGSGPAMTDLLGGQIQVNFDSPPNVLPQLKSGKLKVLAVTSLTRLPMLPDIPTLNESGLLKFESSQWFGVMGPAGLPKKIVHKLNNEFNLILKNPEVIEKIQGQGGTIIGGTPVQFSTFIKGDLDKWSKMIKENGITAD